MIRFLKKALGLKTSSEKQTTAPLATTPSPGRIKNSPDRHGLDIRVGKPPHARPSHVPHTALKVCPLLRRRLVQGSTIVNADPVVFEVIVKYLDSCELLRKILQTKNPLEQLIGSGDMLLKFAKAWHIGQMLGLPQLQNRIVDTFRVLYLTLLNTRTRIPPCGEPFSYLRDHMGYHTKAEKFLVDFYAGLSRYGEQFRPQELQRLPWDISQQLLLRCKHLAIQQSHGDFIARGDPRFKVSKLDDTQQTVLYILPPLVTFSAANSPRPPRRRVLSLPKPSNYPSYSPSAQPVPLMTPELSLTRYHRGHRLRLSLPGLTSLSGHPEVLVSLALLPVLHSAFGTTIWAPQTRPSPTMDWQVIRTPFMRRLQMTA